MEPVNDLDVKVQFVEYVMKTNPEVIRKMRLHTLGTFQKVRHDPNNPDDAGQYKFYTTNAKPGNWTYEIIVIKGFKYEPGKYADVAAGKRKIPLYEEARSILYDPL